MVGKGGGGENCEILHDINSYWRFSWDLNLIVVCATKSILGTTVF